MVSRDGTCSISEIDNNSENGKVMTTGEGIKNSYTDEWNRILLGETILYTENGFFGVGSIKINRALDQVNIKGIVTENDEVTFYILSHLPQSNLKQIHVDAFNELIYIPIAAFITISVFSVILAVTMDKSRRYRVMLKT